MQRVKQNDSIWCTIPRNLNGALRHCRLHNSFGAIADTIVIGDVIYNSAECILLRLLE